MTGSGTSQVGSAPETSAPNVARDAPLADGSRKASWPLWAGVAILVLLAVAAGLLYLRRRQVIASAAHPVPKPRAQQSLGLLREAMRGACVSNDASAASRALLAWTQALWSDRPPANLAAVAARIEQGEGPGSVPAAEQVRELERRLYAPDAGPWDGEALWLCLKDGLAARRLRDQSGQDDLAPLYPRRA